MLKHVANMIAPNVIELSSHVGDDSAPNVLNRERAIASMLVIVKFAAVKLEPRLQGLKESRGHFCGVRFGCRLFERARVRRLRRFGRVHQLAKSGGSAGDYEVVEPYFFRHWDRRAARPL